MRSMIVACVVVLTSASAAAAQALYDFSWQSTATYDRFTPTGGEIGPFSGALSGQGLLSLSPLAGGGYTFQFSGAGGSGAGTAVTTPAQPLEIQHGQLTFPIPPDVIVHDQFLTEPRPGVLGWMEITGDPAAPDSLSIRFGEGGHSNTFGANWSVAFFGAGVPSGTPRTAAPEPAAAAWLVGGALLAALVVRHAPSRCIARPRGAPDVLRQARRRARSPRRR